MEEKTSERKRIVIAKHFKSKMKATTSPRSEGSTHQHKGPTILELLTSKMQRAPQRDKTESCKDGHYERVHDEADYVKSVLQEACRTLPHPLAGSLAHIASSPIQ